MNRAQLPVFNYSVKNHGDEALDIYIDGDIVDADTQAFFKSYFGDDTSVSYKSFRDLVNKSDAKIFNVYINSGGGQVTEAMAIHDLLQDLQDKGKTVNTYGRGIVASSATYILMAGKSPSMSSNSWLMIHNVNGFAYGTVNEIENYAATMRKFNDQVNSFYQNATGLSKTVISNLMDAETWMTADEAKAKNFIKNIGPEATFQNSIKPEKWLFENKTVLNFYNSFINQNTPTMDTSKITEAITNGFNSLLEKLGIKDKAEDKNVKDAFADFSKSITDNLKDVPDEASIQELINKSVETIVNKAVAKSLETVPENFTKAITDSMKELVTKKEIENTLTKADFKKEMEEFQNAVIAKIGNPTNAGKEENAKDKKVPKNRFADAFDAYYEN